MSLRLLTLFIVMSIAALSGWWWMLSDTSNATYAEHPELWEGAGGATGGIKRPLRVPPLDPIALPGISDFTALNELKGKRWEEIKALMQREPDRIDGGDGPYRIAIWHSAVKLDQPDPKWRFPVAHLRLDLLVDQGADLNTATVDAASLLGTFAACFASTDPARISKSPGPQ